MNLRESLNLTRQMGPGWVAFRTAYAVSRKIGLQRRRFPLKQWDDFSLDRPGYTSKVLRDLLQNEWATHFFPKARPENLSNPELNLDQLKAGIFPFFYGATRQIGWPPRWHQSPENGFVWPRVHWTLLPELGNSDVKWTWEIGRFVVAFDLVRAFRKTLDERYAEAFWELVGSFQAENPPNLGVHWMCGQECAFRVIAWTFALFGLRDAAATTPDRISMLLQMLWAHGERIERNVDFAVSQKNNHAINEALALFTLGILFPILPASQPWKSSGRKILEQEVHKQIYNDGSYIQHSLNYHRLMLQSYSWAILLGQINGESFSDELMQHCRRAANLLYQLVDDSSGCAPNYGSNDGSLLFKLDNCDFNDYRPTLALAFWILDRRRVFEPGPWDEVFAWCCGDEPLKSEVKPIAKTDVSAQEGGYYTIRDATSWAFLRCGTVNDRPAQADLLHVDLWWKGSNVIADPGTYSYNSPSPWNNSLASTRVHNTLTVDDAGQMVRGPRFTWFYWPRAEMIRCERNSEYAILEGQHYGYQDRFGIVHRRALLHIPDTLWIIVDELQGSGARTASCQWLFPQSSVHDEGNKCFELKSGNGTIRSQFVSSSGNLNIVKHEALDDSEYGWFSKSYGVKEPATGCLLLSEAASLPLRWYAIFSLDDACEIRIGDDDHLEIQQKTRRIQLQLRPLSKNPEKSIIISVVSTK